ncbi:MAG: hypothetical protein M1820_010902, partial [Bogoriella megaspora]
PPDPQEQVDAQIRADEASSHGVRFSSTAAESANILNKNKHGAQPSPSSKTPPPILKNGGSRSGTSQKDMQKKLPPRSRTAASIARHNGRIEDEDRSVINDSNEDIELISFPKLQELNKQVQEFPRQPKRKASAIANGEFPGDGLRSSKRMKINKVQANYSPRRSTRVATQASTAYPNGKPSNPAPSPKSAGSAHKTVQSFEGQKRGPGRPRKSRPSNPNSEGIEDSANQGSVSHDTEAEPPRGSSRSPRKSQVSSHETPENRNAPVGPSVGVGGSGTQESSTAVERGQPKEATEAAETATEKNSTANESAEESEQSDGPDQDVANSHEEAGIDPEVPSSGASIVEHGEDYQDSEEDNPLSVPLPQLGNESLLGQGEDFRKLLQGIEELIAATQKSDKTIMETKNCYRGTIRQIGKQLGEAEKIIQDLSSHDEEHATADVESISAVAERLEEHIANFKINGRRNGSKGSYGKRVVLGTYVYLIPALVRIFVTTALIYDRRYHGIPEHLLSSREDQVTILESIIRIVQTFYFLSDKLQKATDDNRIWKPTSIPGVLKAFRHEIVPAFNNISVTFKEEPRRQVRLRKGYERDIANQQRERQQGERLRQRWERERQNEEVNEMWRTLSITRALVEPIPAAKSRFMIAINDDDEMASDDEDSVYDEYGERGERVSLFGPRPSNSARRSTSSLNGRRAWTEDQSVALVEAFDAFYNLPDQAKAKRGLLKPLETHLYQFVFRICCGWRGPLRDKDAIDIVKQANAMRQQWIEDEGEIEDWVERIPAIPLRPGM